jgi:hypothetical protein
LINLAGSRDEPVNPGVRNSSTADDHTVGEQCQAPQVSAVLIRPSSEQVYVLYWISTGTGISFATTVLELVFCVCKNVRKTVH